MKNKLLAIFATIVLVLPTFLFFLGDKFYTFHDETQIANLHQYFKAIDRGQFPPRWAPDMHFTYGSPFLSFNYQLPYYLGYLGHLAGLPLTVIFKLLMALSVIAGVLGIFFLGTFLTGSLLLSVFASVFYAYTPYQSIDHFVRGTLGESFALALFPWIILALFALIKKVTTARVIILGVLLSLLVISHQPAALFAIPLFTVIFMGASFFSGKKDRIVPMIKSLILTLLLSAFYLVPVLVERQFINQASPFNYLDHFPFIKQLIYSAWSYQGASPFSDDTMSFQIGIVNLLIVLVSSIYAVVMFHKKTKDRTNYLILVLMLVSTFFVVFLMNIRSVFIWRSFLLIQAIQFPWRLLMFTTIFTPVLFLLLAKELKFKWLTKVVAILLLAVIGINIGYFRPGLVTNRDDEYYLRRFLPQEVLMEGEVVSADYLNHAEDYAVLPLGVIRPKGLPSSKLTSDIPLEIEVTNDNPFNFVAQTNSDNSSVLTFHTFVYPGWTVKIDGMETEIMPDELGAITFKLPPGNHAVAISFLDTPARRISNIISLATVILICLWAVTKLNKRDSSTT